MNKLLLIGSVLGFTSVAMGALADHHFTLDEQQAESLATAIHYNGLYAILVVALSFREADAAIHRAAWIFAVGTFLFSFSIYAATWTGIREMTFLTPVGGITLMLGWIFLAVIAGRRAFR